MINWIIAPFALVNLLVAVATLLMALVMARRSGITASRTFVWLFLSVSLWALMTALHFISTDLDVKDFWKKVQLLAVCSAPMLLLLCIIYYTGQEHYLRKGRLIALCIIPAVCLLVGLTNDLHHLYWKSVSYVPDTTRVILDYGPFFWIYTVYAYLLIMAVTLLLLRAIIVYSEKYHNQALILIVVALVPWAGNFVTILRLAPGYDYTPIGIFITTLMLYWAIYRQGIFRLSPIAWDKILGWIEDGFIVLDNTGNVVDINRYAENMLSRAARENSEIPQNWVGQTAEKLLEIWPELQTVYPFIACEEHDITLGEGDSVEYVDMDISPLEGGSGQEIGKLLLFHDVTRLKLAQNESERRRQMADDLLTTGYILDDPGNLKEGLHKALIRLRRVIPCDGVVVSLQKNDGLELFYQQGLTNDHLPPDIDLSRVMAIYDEHALYRNLRESVRKCLLTIDPGIVSLMITPMIYRKAVTGMLAFFRHDDKPFSKDEERTSASLALQIANTQADLQMFQKVEQMAVTDALTGKYNRRQFFTLATNLFNHAVRYNEPFTVIMLDIDHFKNVNDTYGHQAGDEILRVVSDTCHKQVRQVDIFARYGGEEFIFALPQTSLTDAALVAGRIRQAVEDSRYDYNETHIPITISLGVASCDPSHDTIEKLIERSDQALYEAKQSGRNRVCTLPPLA
jgi:diguanylate cyclase (GGDEF)-like protein